MQPYSQSAADAYRLLLQLAQQPTPEVCPRSASKWARAELGFPATRKQKEVLDSTSSRLIVCGPCQWGKSTVIALKALHYALAHANSEILVLSATEGHAGIVVGKVIDSAAALHIPRRAVPGRRHSIQLPNGAKVFAVAHNQRAVSGLTAHVLIVDDAALVDSHVFSYATRVLSRTNGDIWLVSTPRGQTGFFYDLWHTGASRWHRVHATFRDARYLEVPSLQERKRLFTDTFRQDFLCEFIPESGRLLSRERIAACADPSLNSRILHEETEGQP